MLKKVKFQIRSKMKKITNNISIAILLILSFSCKQKTDNTTEKSSQEILSSVNEIKAIGKVYPKDDYALIGSTVNGIVEKVFIKEGDSISQGQIIAQIKNENANLDLNEGQIQLLTIQEQNKVILTEIKQAEIKANELGEIFNTSKALFRQNAETKEKLNIDESNYLQQINLVKNLKQKYTVQITSEKEQNIKNKKLENTTSDFQIRASKDGIITDFNLKLGQTVTTNQDYGKIINVNDPIIEAEVDELFANDIRIGQQVYISAVGRKDTLTTGSVTYVSPILSNKSILYETANEGDDRRVRKLSIKPNYTQDRLTINAKVDCIIKIK